MRSEGVRPDREYRDVFEAGGLASTLTHLVGRAKAFLGELAAIERELALLEEPEAGPVRAALVSTQEAGRPGSLLAVEHAAAESLRRLDRRRSTTG